MWRYKYFVIGSAVLEIGGFLLYISIRVIFYMSDLFHHVCTLLSRSDNIDSCHKYVHIPMDNYFHMLIWENSEELLYNLLFLFETYDTNCIEIIFNFLFIIIFNSLLHNSSWKIHNSLFFIFLFLYIFRSTIIPLNYLFPLCL